MRYLTLFCSLLGMFIIPVVSGDTVSPDSGIKLEKGADYRIVKEYQYPDFKVIQFNLARLSHFSYMLLSGGECLVIDPGRDAGIYREIAKKEKVKIKGVFLTHAHADFVAGHIELAQQTGCPVYVNKANRAVYKHNGVKDGDALKIGKAVVKFIETPGHTPDGMCAPVYGANKPSEPEIIFTGDTLFVNSVGRPDLLEGQVSAVELASKMYDSWFGKLALLDDGGVVLPAHGAGSLCGSKLGKSPSSTIGAEKRNNPYLQHKSKNEFIAAVVNSLAHVPQYFIHNAQLNRQGPPPVKWQELPGKELAIADIDVKNPNTYVIDVRPAEEYAAGHIDNSINIPKSGKLATWLGIVVPWKAKLIVTGSKEEVAEAVHRLQRIGYKPEYVVFETWRKAGGRISGTGLIPPGEIYSQLKGSGPLPLDVRQKSEWDEQRIGNVINMPLQSLDRTKAKLDPAMPLITICRTGYRAGIAAGLLARSGFKNVNIMQGGMEGWNQAKLPTVGAGAVCPLTAASEKSAAPVLPELITVEGLNRLIKDMPDFVEIIDIRPAEQFTDYNIPGSANLELRKLLEQGAPPEGKTLIIVDRDGTVALLAAGILSGKVNRKLKALEGGVEKYWEKTFGAAKRPVPSAKPVQPEKAPQKVKKIIQDAGC
ncbi:MAG: rhodanese-like domain-containing protein [Victivallaceae bacterium]|nr:rhodanese-like domain-containing protein [Victivallaceae bacterium]